MEILLILLVLVVVFVMIIPKAPPIPPQATSNKDSSGNDTIDFISDNVGVDLVERHIKKD